MKPVNRRVVRLLRIERIREIAKQTSLTALAEAERNLTQMQSLSHRIHRLSSTYSGRSDAVDGYMLGQQNRFSSAIVQISRDASNNALNARALADQKLRALEESERRRSAAEDVRVKAERALIKDSANVHMGAKRKNGTVLE